MSVRGKVQEVFDLIYKCEFWRVDGVVCKGYRKGNVTCNKDSGIGCGIRLKLLRVNK